MRKFLIVFLEILFESSAYSKYQERRITATSIYLKIGIIEMSFHIFILIKAQKITKCTSRKQSLSYLGEGIISFFNISSAKSSRRNLCLKKKKKSLSSHCIRSDHPEKQKQALEPQSINYGFLGMHPDSCFSLYYIPHVLINWCQFQSGVGH